MSITAMRQALEALEDLQHDLTKPLDGYHEQSGHVIAALRTAIEQAEKQEPEPVAWLTKELMADYLDMIAEAIEDKKSEMLRHKAYWMRKGDV